MRPSTLFLVTFILWLIAKKRLGMYWQLATTNNGAVVPSGTQAPVGPGSDLSHASALPGFSTVVPPLDPYYTSPVNSQSPIDRILKPLPPLTDSQLN